MPQALYLTVPPARAEGPPLATSWHRQPSHGSQRITGETDWSTHCSSDDVHSENGGGDSVNSPMLARLLLTKDTLLLDVEKGKAPGTLELVRALSGKGGGVGAHKKRRRWCSPSFWTRAALVVILAACMLGATLFVMRLFNNTIYYEAEDLAIRSHRELFDLADTQVAVFVNETTYGATGLSDNLHQQELVALLPADIHNAKARLLLWETFKALPSCYVAAYGMEQGMAAYLRPETGPVLFMQGKPVEDPALASGNLSGTILPVEPLFGQPLGDVDTAPRVALAPFTQEPLYAPTMGGAPGDMFWWVGPTLDKDGGVVMSFMASAPLWVSSDSANGGADQLGINASAVAGGTGLHGRVIGVATVGQAAGTLAGFLTTLDLTGSRLFFSVASSGVMVLASKGATWRLVNGSASAITADMSDDFVIRAAAMHLREKFGATPVVTRGQERGEDGDEDMQAALAALAAKSGLCWRDYDAQIDINGATWYLRCEGRVHGAPHGELAMVGVLLVPRDAIMGDIDAAKRRCINVVLGVVATIAALGVVGVYLSTVYVAILAGAKRALEGLVEKQQGEIQVMTRELDVVRALLPGSRVRSVDLRTPMEALHDLLGDLAQGKARPNSEMIGTIQDMLKMPDPHLPIVLQQSLGMRGASLSTSPTQMSPRSPGFLDEDTAAWLRSSVLGISKRRSVSQGMLSRASTGLRATLEAEAAAASPTRNGATDELFVDRVMGVVEEFFQGRLEAPGHEGPGGESAEPMSGMSHGQRDPAGLPHMANEDRETTEAHEEGADGSTMQDVTALEPHRSGVHPGFSAMRAILKRVGAWSFDTWRFASVSGGRPIMWMGLEVSRRAQLIRTFNLPLDKLVRFLATLDEGMPDNHYHNGTHIADVTNSLYHLIKFSGVSAYLSQLDILAAVTAALVHDFRHPGLNNDFVVKSSDDLALRYNDRTVLENFHVAEAFFLMAEPHLNFLDALRAEDYKYVRHVIIELVLASDL
eukprot:jgi/Mesvir1/1295/Mv03761-RA.4